MELSMNTRLDLCLRLNNMKIICQGWKHIVCCVFIKPEIAGCETAVFSVHYTV